MKDKDLGKNYPLAIVELLYRLEYIDQIAEGTEIPKQDLEILTEQILELPDLDDNDHVADRVRTYFQPDTKEEDYSLVQKDPIQEESASQKKYDKFPTTTEEIIEYMIDQMTNLDRLKKGHPEIKFQWPMTRDKVMSIFPAFDSDFIDFCKGKNFIRTREMNVKGGRKLEGLQEVDVMKLGMLQPFNKGRNTHLKDNSLREVLAEVNKNLRFAIEEYRIRVEFGQIIL